WRTATIPATRASGVLCLELIEGALCIRARPEEKPAVEELPEQLGPLARAFPGRAPSSHGAARGACSVRAQSRDHTRPWWLGPYLCPTRLIGSSARQAAARRSATRRRRSA